MRALRSFTVRARLPEALSPLQELAFNLRWSWDNRTRDLFRWVDPEIWEQTFHDPVGLLGQVGRERLDQLASDPAFMGLLDEMHAELRRYLEGPRWFQNRGESPLRKVAYFSPEFGIAEALPQYSGGLGVLAGDHLKAASSLGVPLVGLGLMYRLGYFRQHLNAEGWQEEHYPILDPHAMALELVDGVRVSVDLAAEKLEAQLWLAQVGRVKLYLLDADIDPNAPEQRAVTDRLYGGGSEHRVRQEILLGMGGVRALDALGSDAQVFHTNEGHAGFLGLERIRKLITADGLTWNEAIEAVRAGTVFTTHTPVPAGIDRFPRELMERYFSKWAEECGISLDTLMDLGHFPGEDAGAPFNMAVMGLRLAGRSNGVAKLHGKTSREMFHGLWSPATSEEVPITSITNGVHGRTWVSSQMDDLYSKYVSPAWDDAGPEEWQRIEDARDDEIWRAKEQGRAALVDFVREHQRAALREAGRWGNELDWIDGILDPRYLIVGFSRRFATYKRATLLFSQPDRLRALLLDEKHPVQMVFAGKAHPADELGKQMIAQIAQLAADPTVRHRVVFIPDYDIAVARMMYQGSDVWLNTPIRPNEASGTSGEKAALNGALNCSILDGWWDEMFEGDNGWAISSAESVADVEQRNHIEANSLFDLLERQIVPLYYTRSGARYPADWVRRIKTSLRTLAPKVMASRMVSDYVREMYEPTASQAVALSADGYARAKALSAWKARVARAWGGVKIVSVDADNSTGMVDLGGERATTVSVELGSLDPSDIAVELLHGPVGSGEELHADQIVRLEQVPGDAAPIRYRGTFTADHTGRHGFTVRVVPSHPDLVNPVELGCIAWAV